MEGWWDGVARWPIELRIDCRGECSIVCGTVICQAVPLMVSSNRFKLVSTLTSVYLPSRLQIGQTTRINRPRRRTWCTPRRMHSTHSFNNGQPSAVIGPARRIHWHGTSSTPVESKFKFKVTLTRKEVSLNSWKA